MPVKENICESIRSKTMKQFYRENNKFDESIFSKNSVKGQLVAFHQL